MENVGNDSGEGDDESKAATVAKVATEAAEVDFARFIKAMDLDIDPIGMDDDDKASFVAWKRVMIRAIVKGTLAVEEAGEPVYTPTMGKNQEPITFYEPRGSTWMAMDSKKKGHDFKKMFASMAEMTKTSEVTFSNMYGRDLKVCQAIVMLFLA